MCERLSTIIEMQEQTGPSRMEDLLMKAAKSRWARGTAAVLGLSGASIVTADILNLQSPVSAHVRQIEQITPTVTLTETPTPLPVIATAQAKRTEAAAREQAIKDSKDASATATAVAATAIAIATQQSANTTATAIVKQSREDYPNWAAEKDKEENNQSVMIVLFTTLTAWIIYWSLIISQKIMKHKH